MNGRKIEYRYYDDAYNPAQTVQLTRRLVEQDKVFAIFNSVGTQNNLAIRDYLNAQKVPQLFAADGSQSIGRSWSKYPWTMGFLQSYRGEGDVYGKTHREVAPEGEDRGPLREHRARPRHADGTRRARSRARDRSRRQPVVRVHRRGRLLARSGS